MELFNIGKLAFTKYNSYRLEILIMLHPKIVDIDNIDQILIKLTTEGNFIFIIYFHIFYNILYLYYYRACIIYFKNWTSI